MVVANASEGNGNHKFNEPIPCGSISLDFITRSKLSGNYRSLIVGFHLSDDPQGRMVFCAEDELLRFPKFQKRALEKGGVFIDHPAASGTAATKKKWNDEIALAMKAGQSVDANHCGHRLIGGL